jgi:endonuclease YncB( thermonuclease family)
MKQFWLLLGLLVFCAATVGAATCTGSASCRACSNCSRCKYCSGGGSCGVCVPSKGASPPSSSTQSAAEPSPKAKRDSPKVKRDSPKAKRDCCTGILDAETIMVTKADGKPVKVRLLGVSTPGTQGLSDTPPVNATLEVGTMLARVTRGYHQEPIRFMESYILNHEVTLEVDPSSPKALDDNMVAYVYRGSSSQTLNEVMILSGLGIVQRDPQFGKLGQFNDAERIARTKLVGYWRWLKKNEQRASTWLKMGDNLRRTNAKATRKYYTDILNTYPDTESATVARQRLKSLPE